MFGVSQSLRSSQPSLSPTTGVTVQNRYDPADISVHLRRGRQLHSQAFRAFLSSTPRALVFLATRATRGVEAFYEWLFAPFQKQGSKT